MKSLTLIATIAWIVLVSLAACSPQDIPLFDTDQAAVLAFSEAATDNLFTGLTADDYATFSRDFDAEMQAAMPAANFTILKQNLDNKIGK